jgi:hypothetical protein
MASQADLCTLAYIRQKNGALTKGACTGKSERNLG